MPAESSAATSNKGVSSASMADSAGPVRYYGKAFVRGARTQGSKNPRTIYTLIGCGIFTLACASMPYFITKKMKPLNSREEVRTSQVARRRLSRFAFLYGP